MNLTLPYFINSQVTTTVDENARKMEIFDGLQKFES